MLLEAMNVVITGGSGAIGAATARAMAREGARVLLGARDAGRLEALRDEIRATGGEAESFTLDTLDAADTEAKIAALAARHGEIDAALNATSFMHVQGPTIEALSLEDFMQPIDTFLPSLFNTTKAVVPHMGKTKPGVIVTLSTPGGRSATPGHLGYSAACAGVESFTRVLGAELGPRNIRVVCLAPHAISDAPAAGSYTRELFVPKAAAMGLSVETWLAGGAQTTMLGRLPTLEDVAETAVFLVSRKARAMTGAYVNLSAGMIAD